MVTSCTFEEMTLFLQSGCKTNSLWTFWIISETHHVPPDFAIYVEWYLMTFIHSFYHLFFFNKRDIGHLLCMLLVFVLSGQQMLLIWAIIDSRSWLQWQHFNAETCVIMLFPCVLWLWHFLHSVSPHPVSSLHIYTLAVSRACMAGAASQAGDADSSRAPGLTSGLQGFVNVHRGALLLVPKWQCISSFVFYIFVTLVPFAVWSW